MLRTLRMRDEAIKVAQKATSTFTVGLGLAALLVAVAALPAEARKKPRAERPADVAIPDPTSGEPMTLIISLRQQKIDVYRGTSHVTSSKVSTGMRGYATKAGVYSILEKRRHHHSNIYSGAPMPWMQRMTWTGTALHGGVVPGYPASHGCVRLPFSFAPKLFSTTTVGEHVVVARSAVAPQLIEHAALFQPLPPPSAPAVVKQEARPERQSRNETAPAPTPAAPILLARADMGGVTVDVPQSVGTPAPEASAPAPSKPAAATPAAPDLTEDTRTHAIDPFAPAGAAEHAFVPAPAIEPGEHAATAPPQLEPKDPEDHAKGADNVATASEPQPPAAVEADPITTQTIATAETAKAAPPEAVNADPITTQTVATAETAKPAPPEAVEADPIKTQTVATAETAKAAPPAAVEADPIVKEAEAAPAPAEAAPVKAAAAVNEAEAETAPVKAAPVEAAPAVTPVAAVVDTMPAATPAVAVAPATSRSPEAAETPEIANVIPVVATTEVPNAAKAVAPVAPPEAPPSLAAARLGAGAKAAALEAAEPRSTAPLRILVTRRTKADRIIGMQNLLADMGYLMPQNFDGTLGRATVQAIKAFQKANGLPETGTFTDELVKKVYEVAGKGEPPAGHLFVRQEFGRVFDVPVSFRDPEAPLGTHLFTALKFTPGDTKARWMAVSLQGDDSAAVLDRLEIPEDVRRDISERLTPGSSLIVGDVAINSATLPKGADFLVWARDVPAKVTAASLEPDVAAQPRPKKRKRAVRTTRPTHDYTYRYAPRSYQQRGYGREYPRWPW